MDGKENFSQILDEVNEKLVFEMPVDLDLWHWSFPENYYSVIRSINGRKDFCDFSIGATGKGLYGSTSAIDLMNKGSRVIYFKLAKGSKIVVIDPRLFGIGIEEFYEASLKQMNIPTVEYKTYSKNIIKYYRENPSIRKMDELMVALDVDASFFSLAINMSAMIRKNKAIILDNEIDAEDTVVEYYNNNPNEMLIFTTEHLKRFLARKGIAYTRSKKMMLPQF